MMHTNSGFSFFLMLLPQYPVKLAQMVIFYLFSLILAMDITVSGWRTGVDSLNMNYYMMNCPFAEGTIKNTVNRALLSDPTLAAGLVRMHFHDCFIEVLSLSLSHKF